MDDATADGRPLCPWCSAELGAGATTCPSCGATLTAADEPQIPGVTTVIGGRSRSRREPRASRLMRWISGDTVPEPGTAAPLPSAPPGSGAPGPSSPGPSLGASSGAVPPGRSHASSLGPPPADVQAEMRRLEVEAQLSKVTAEASANAADDALEAREANDGAAAEAALQVARDARAVAEALDQAGSSGLPPVG